MLPFATIWMDLEDIMLGEINQPEKDKYRMISYMQSIKFCFKKAHGDRELTDG